MTKDKAKQSPFVRISRVEWVRAFKITKDNSTRPLPSPTHQKRKSK